MIGNGGDKLINALLMLLLLGPVLVVIAAIGLGVLAAKFPWVFIPLIGSIAAVVAIGAHLDKIKKYWSSFKTSWKNFFNPHDESLLSACHVLNFKDILTAIEKGASVNCTDAAGNTPLLILLSRNISRPDLKDSLLSMIQILILKGADPTISNDLGSKALFLIINKSWVDIIPLFKGMDIFNTVPQHVKGMDTSAHLRDLRYKTPLMKAVEICHQPTNNNLKVLEELLACDADPNIKSLVGYENSDTVWMTPLISLLHSLVEVNHNPQEKEKLCHLLLDNGANPCASLDRITPTGEITRRNYLMELNARQKASIQVLYDRCIKIIGEQDVSFSLPEGIEESKDKALIDKTVQEAIRYQAASRADAIESLTDVFLQVNNTVGLTSLNAHCKPSLAGYANFHLKLALASLEAAEKAFTAALEIQATGKTKDISLLDGNPEAKEKVLEHRRLALEHFLKGMRSQEETPNAKQTIAEIQRLFEITLTEWKMEKPSAGNVDLSTTDIDAEIAHMLIQGTQASTQLYHLKKAAETTIIKPTATANAPKFS